MKVGRGGGLTSLPILVTKSGGAENTFFSLTLYSFQKRGGPGPSIFDFGFFFVFVNFTHW